MATVYKTMVCDSLFTQNGLSTWTQTGQTVLVDGVEMVRFDSGHIHPFAGYFDTKSAAQLAAADRLDELGQRLLAQAARFRLDAGRIGASEFANVTIATGAAT